MPASALKIKIANQLLGRCLGRTRQLDQVAEWWWGGNVLRKVWGCSVHHWGIIQPDGAPCPIWIMLCVGNMDILLCRLLLFACVFGFIYATFHRSLHHFVNIEAENVAQDLNFHFCTFGNVLKCSLVNRKVFTNWVDLPRGRCTESVSVGNSATLPHFKH